MIKPGPPQLRLRRRGVSAARHGEDKGGAATHRCDAVGGEQEDAATGGVRESDGGRSVQRHHMGCGGRSWCTRGAGEIYQRREEREMKNRDPNVIKEI